MTFLFGSKPSHPPVVVPPTPIQEVLQANKADDIIRKELIKKRKATMLSQQNQAAPIIKTEKLGAGV